jgi:hypothetical protein
MSKSCWTPVADILFQEPFQMQILLLCERRLSESSIAANSITILGRILDEPINNQLITDQ